MTPEQFGQAILESFTEVYGKCYIGTLFINKLPTEGYDIGIAFNHREVALHIAAEIADQKKFLKFFKKELKARQMSIVQFSRVSREYPPLFNKPDGTKPQETPEVLIHPNMNE